MFSYDMYTMQGNITLAYMYVHTAKPFEQSSNTVYFDLLLKIANKRNHLQRLCFF